MVLGFGEALDVVLQHAARVTAEAHEEVGLRASAGRVLAERLVADRDQPAFARSTRDGFAVRTAEGDGPRRIVGTLRAGETWGGGELGSGDALEIMTGAAVPAGADAVVMVEHVAVTDGMVSVAAGRAIRAGMNVVPRGSEAQAGDGVLRAGCVMAAAEIAVAASCGYATVPVFRRPRVAVIATGDELVAMEATPGAMEIRNSNSDALAAAVEAEGGEAQMVGIARDSHASLRERMAEAAEAELVLLSGGVSMGKYDFVEEVLAERGAEFFFTGVRMQPGKPVVFGRVGRQYFFGLPGNPVSTQVTFAVLVAPLLRALCGREEVGPRFVEARLAVDVEGAERTRFLPAEIGGDWRGVTVRPVSWQGSGDVAANARGNGYVVLPEGVAARTGDVVRVLLR